jgi:hypothetical protein
MTDRMREMAEAVALLQHSQSPKRRSGAKRLRKLQEPAAGPALLDALIRELADPRTWETQCEMIRALGACSYTPAVSYLDELVRKFFKARMVYFALGYALFLLKRYETVEADIVLQCIASNNDLFIAGSLEAASDLSVQLDQDMIAQVLNYVESQPIDLSTHALWQATALAAAVWQGTRVEAFLTRCKDELPAFVYLGAQKKRQMYGRSTKKPDAASVTRMQ